jgi:NitT/TauT family transport system ATP-binding protein
MATVTVKNLVKIFPPPRSGNPPVRAINDISFEISGHVFVSIVGPSGCGKSTLLNILSGIEKPSAGSVKVDQEGKPAQKGYVFQDPRLLPWRTVIQNMLYVSDLPEKEAIGNAKEHLAMVGLSGADDMYPGQLSGGMQQRVGIARAFSVAPDILFMDEPFSHLDAITARSLRLQLQEIWNETRKTVVFVTHDVIEAVQLSDRIIIMEHSGSIHGDIEIDLPHPRKISDPKVALRQAEILGIFESMVEDEDQIEKEISPNI